MTTINLLLLNIFNKCKYVKFKCVIFYKSCYFLPGQQLIQLPDGKLHVTSYINQGSSPRTVQIAKNTMLANNNNFTKTSSQVSFRRLLTFE